MKICPKSLFSVYIILYVMSSRRYASRVICARYVTSRYHTLSVIFILKSAVTAPYIIFIPKFISPPPQQPQVVAVVSQGSHAPASDQGSAGTSLPQN